MTETKATALVIPPPNPHNVEATKYYIFNETGNIMMASTKDASSDLDESVRSVFAEVSVFFAAMTRAITTTENPATGQPYSLYDYSALEKILGGSGLFSWVTREDITHHTWSSGADFSKELITGLLGLAVGAGALSFAQGMISSMGQEAFRMSESGEKNTAKVGNVVFVCEYLMGMPTVSAIVVYASVEKNEEHIRLGPCFSVDRTESKWQLHKDTYLFVTPRFVREYSADLDTVGENLDFARFVEYLRSVLKSVPHIVEVLDSNKKPVSDTLKLGENYTVMGTNLEDTVAVNFEGKDFLTLGEVDQLMVPFSVKPEAQPDSVGHVCLVDAEDKVIVRSPKSYKLVK